MSLCATNVFKLMIVMIQASALTALSPTDDMCVDNAAFKVQLDSVNEVKILTQF